MKELLKALGLTPPAIAIITSLIAVIYIGVKKISEQIMGQVKKDREELKKTLDEIKRDIKDVKEEDKKQNKGLIQVIYHQCLAEALKWKEKGYIDNNAKIQFNFRWRNYKDLGDGLGDEPIKIVNSLEIKM